MKLADLSPELLERIKSWRYDRILEKHEGPENWSSVLEYYNSEFLRLDGHDVLLPLERENLPNISLLRCIESKDGKTLTLFLKDTTYVTNPRDEFFDAGRIAICEKVSGAEFYIAVVYHAWFMVDNKGLSE